MHARRLKIGGVMTLGVMMAGLLVGAVPALAAAPETPELKVEEPVHATTATFHGILNPNEANEPNNKGGSYKFLYKAGATCTGGSVTKPSGLALGGVHEELPAETVTGLTPDTAYTVCLSVTNLEGETTVSMPVPFKTAVAPEKPVTGSTTAVTSTSEKVEGTLDPHSTLKVGGYFAYSNPDGSSCLEGPTAGLEEFEGEKEETILVHTTIGGLEPHQKYKVCLVASDELGDTTDGNEASFTTEPAPPQIENESTSEVKDTSVTLDAQINPNNEKTKYTFEYSTTENGAGALTGTIIKEPGAAELEGYREKLGSVTLTGLEAGKTYFYRVVAENAQSKTEPKPVEYPAAGVQSQSFTTLPAPTTDPVTALTATTVTFHGHLTPLNEKVATQYRFNYKLGSECAGENATQTEEAGTGKGTEVQATANVTELQPNAQYTVCLVASNESGSVEGPPVHFTTLAVPPKIDSESISGVSASEATLEAVINPNNREVTYAFQYATNPQLTGATTVAGTEPHSGFGEQGLGTTLTGLAIGETYYYRVVLENTSTHEVVDGQVKSLTPLGAPLVTDVEGQSVTAIGATLTGAVNPAGAATLYHFEYIAQLGYEEGLEKNPADPFALAKRTSAEPLSEGFEAVPVKFSVAELAPGTVYEVELVAENPTGTTTTGSPVAFTTAEGTPPSPPPGEGEAVNPSPGPSPFPAVTPAPVVPYQTIAQLQAKEPKVNPASGGKPTKKKNKKKHAKRHKRAARKGRK